MEAFYAGYQELDVVDWDLLVKLDGDLSLPTDYFESCISEFAKRPKLGIGGGLVCKLSGDQLLPESPSDPVFHVRGAVKMYRVECWRDIGGLVKGPCWDSIDELHANMLQWETQTFIEVKAHHKRPAGAAYGPLKDWAKGGRGNYITGYHPLFFFVKCLRRLLRGEVTAAAGLSYGYMAAQLRREKRMVSKTLMTYIRREQLRTLLGRQTLWAKSVRDRPA